MAAATGFLYIEPVGPASKQPVIDELTCLMTDALRRALADPSRRGAYLNGHFYASTSLKGLHICNCGAKSACYDVQLLSGQVTNTLAVHYLAHHRDEVPEDQLQIVQSLLTAQVEPTNAELQSPK